MMRPVRFFVAIALSIVATVCLANCGGGGEDAVRPETGGKILTVPPGDYELYFAGWVCGTADTSWTMQPSTACTSIPTNQDNEIFPCPVTIEDDVLTFKCSESVDNGGCTTTVEYDFNGIQIGDLWVLTGFIRETTSSPGCTPDTPCAEYDVYIERVGPATSCP